MKANRRSFLKNTAAGALALGISKVISPNEKKKQEDLVSCDKTTQDYYGQGPFYTENPPFLENNKLAKDDEEGEKVIISGRVLNLECNQFITDAIVDIWHANAAGNYDNASFNLRGYTKTNEQGFYLFETIMPGKYLNGNRFRPSHIHYKITPPDFEELTTQLYFAGDSDIPADAAASLTSGQFDASNRIIDLVKNADGILEGTFDVIINGEGTSVGTQNIHLNKGMIYKASPNPFANELEIHFGVFKKSTVGIIVYNMQGQEVAILENEEKNADKYFVTWIPDAYLPSGHYFVAIRINDQQVHYLKVVKN